VVCISDYYLNTKVSSVSAVLYRLGNVSETCFFWLYRSLILTPSYLRRVFGMAHLIRINTAKISKLSVFVPEYKQDNLVLFILFLVALDRSD
jgi:hypothetical protein